MSAMSVSMDSFTSEDSLSHSAVETRYQKARAALERAKAQRSEAVCEFLEVQATANFR